MPPLTEYCKDEPVGQAAAGAVILPALTVQVDVQTLLTILTLAGAAVNVGQVTTQLPVTVADFEDIQPLLSVTETV